HFTTHKKEGDREEIKGVSFSFGSDDGGIKLVSTENQGVSDRTYRDPAPHVPAPKTYGLGTMTIAGGNLAVADAGQDAGREPEGVILLRSADFEGTPPRDRRIPILPLSALSGQLIPLTALDRLDAPLYRTLL